MDGVIVASDQTLEWLLPWWLKNYQKHNSYPVAFIDLGLSFEAKDWCKKNGEWIPLRIADFAEETDQETAEEWEREFGRHFWSSRDAWFKKPLACLKSPFQRSLWIDVDCEVRAPLTPLFEYANPPIGFAMAKEQVDPSKTHQIYNSGVIAFNQNHPLLKEWADLCLSGSRRHRGDQEAFSYLIGEKGIQIGEIPPLYNWSRCKEDRADVAIQHWHGHHGKAVIRNLMGGELS